MYVHMFIINSGMPEVISTKFGGKIPLAPLGMGWGGVTLENNRK